MISIKSDDIIKAADEFLRRNGHIPNPVGGLREMRQDDGGRTTVGLSLLGSDAVAYVTVDAEGNEVGFSLESPDSDE